ncbi:hypothetical protein ASC99_20295 [Kitasatospora sp. Root107]|nr:hypothetical protein ASC99_20295 [Kitasatospora sp. Root107]
MLGLDIGRIEPAAASERLHGRTTDEGKGLFVRVLCGAFVAEKGVAVTAEDRSQCAETASGRGQPDSRVGEVYGLHGCLHVSRELGLACEDVDHEVLIAGGVGPVDSAIRPVLGGEVVAAVLVQPAAELRVLRLDLEQVAPIATGSFRPKLCDESDVVFGSRHDMTGAEDVVALHE